MPAPQPQTADEPVLIAALRRGDREAFEQLVSMHAPAVRRVAAEHVTTRAVQDEVAQDTWLAVWEGLARFEGRSTLRTWILAIARNLAITRGVHDARVVALADLEGQVALGAVSAGGIPHALPYDRAVAGELRARLGSALRGLPDRQRRVWVLREVEGRSAGEVCSVLGVSPGNQRVLLHRARVHLRAAIDDR